FNRQWGRQCSFLSQGCFSFIVAAGADCFPGYQILSMIEIKNLKKGFADKTVLNNVNVEMRTGQCNLIIGSSGSGKTVFMKCLVGLFQPDSGDILYGGQNFTQMTTEHK